jgi:hypothetical protein
MTRHKTPIKVVAHAGEQTREQYETSAIDLFCYVPQQWRGRNSRLVLSLQSNSGHSAYQFGISSV